MAHTQKIEKPKAFLKVPAYEETYENFNPVLQDEDTVDSRTNFEETTSIKAMEVTMKSRQEEPMIKSQSIRSKFENTVPAKKPAPLLIREQQYRSQNVVENVELPSYTSTNVQKGTIT